MGGSGTQQTRLLPGNIWDALLGANAPSGSNVFATIADIGGAVTTLYSGNGTIGTNREATLTDSLNFIVSGTNGISIGPTPFVTTHTLEVRNASNTRYTIIQGATQTVGTIAFLVSNPVTSIAIFYNNGSASLGSVGTSLVTIGVGSGSPTAKLTVTGRGATSATINQHWRNSAITTIMQLNDDGNLGLGVIPTTTDRLLIQGTGTSSATTAQRWLNSTPTELMRLNDAGQLGINTSDFTTGIAGASRKFIIRDSKVSSVSDTTAYITSDINPAVSNADFNRALTTVAYKLGAQNTYQVVSIYNYAENQGSGTISELFASHQIVKSTANATITNLFSVYADKQIQAGTITIAASLVADTTSIAGGTITNLFGLYVKTPTNSGATITTTAGVYIESNNFGTNNYAIISASQNTTGLGITNPNQNSLLVLSSTTKAGLQIMAMTAAEAGAITPAEGMIVNVSNTDGTFTSIGLWGYQNGAWAKL